jgi:hypothetical protein
MTTTRTVREIALEIKSDWRPVYFGAVPYLQAMLAMTSPEDRTGFDTGQDIILHFLCNASTWRGDVARRVKLELKSMIK